MAKQNKNSTTTVTLDRDDVDNAILDYIHAHRPETAGLDISDWKFKGGCVRVEFDNDTYEKLGRVSEQEHNEALDEIESLLDENEQLQSDIEELESDREYLSGEVDGLNEELVEKDEYIRKLEKRLERALNDLEDATDNGCCDGPRRPHHLF